jgi:hypothetical protein
VEAAIRVEGSQQDDHFNSEDKPIHLLAFSKIRN